MSKNRHCIIVGGGIVGLTTALELHKIGIDVQLYEATSEIQELGVGLSLLPHSVKHLYDHGLQEALDQNAIRTKELIFCCENGKQIWREPRGLDAGYKVPQYSIHRGRLQKILLDKVIGALGKDAVHTNARLIRFDQDDKQVSAYFRRADGEEFQVRADMLIGADGINSVVRQQLHPNQGEPHFAGLMLWRGATWADTFLTGRSMVMTGFSDQKLVIYPMTPPNAAGKQLINWVAELKVDQGILRSDDWNSGGKLEDFLPQFENWQYPWLDTHALFHNAEGIYKFPMIDRDPVAQWSFDRVTLAGDAAHAMYPNGSNGASQGILDSVALAEALSKERNIIQALISYQDQRLPKTSKLSLDNRNTGPERVLQMVKDKCQGDCEKTHSCVPFDDLKAVADSYKKLAGFDKQTVNA